MEYALALTAADVGFQPVTPLSTATADTTATVDYPSLRVRHCTFIGRRTSPGILKYYGGKYESVCGSSVWQHIVCCVLCYVIV